MIVKIGHKEGFQESLDIREQAKRRYTWIKQQTTPATLTSTTPTSTTTTTTQINLEFNEDSHTILINILPLLMQQFDVKEPGILIPLIKILSSILSNSAICYSVCCDILERPGWFFVPDSGNYRLRLTLFHELVRISIPKSSVVLDQIGALEDQHLSNIFIDFFDGILSRDEKYRLVS